MSTVYDFEVERNVTRIYKEYQNAHTAIREAMCLEQMYPAILCGIRPGDVFAGRIQMSFAGFSPEPGGLGYYCNQEAIRQLLQENTYPETLQREMEELLTFWEKENTQTRVRAAYPPEVAKALPSDKWETVSMAAAPLYRMAGSYLDYEKLLENGIPGLEQIAAERKKEAQQGTDAQLFEGMEIALRILKKCCIYYHDMALELLGQTTDKEESFRLQEMAEALLKISAHRPETLREAIQLMWLYILISGTYNYGRVDVILGDFLARDLENKVITQDQAQILFNGFWRLIADRRTTWNGRVVLGGKGRRNEKNADMAAMLAMEASRVTGDIEPQLTLRIYKEMDPKLMDKALEVIGAGFTYPMLYNDEVNIPAVSNAFRVDEKLAADYVPFGCGEYVLDHRSYGSPNGIINLLKVLEITLHNGRDAVTGEPAGIPTGEFRDFKTFDQLWEAYKKQAEYFISALVVQEAIEYQIAGETAPFLFLSMLMDDCMERGKGIFCGGIRYLGGTVETYGNINTADSLTAIKEMVYDKGMISPETLLKALDNDFKDYQRERQLLSRAPKYGNDDPQADEMAVQVHEHICNYVRNQAQKAGLHSYLVVIINNSANTTLGKLTAASADGRGKGIHMANANNPWGGNDKKGLTAMLNSLVKLNPNIHAGAVQNMKFSPELFLNDGKLIRSVLKSYFEKGGTQAMISVVKKDDLEQAMLHPEKYGNLLVRVGGFSARFVELEKAVQLEIISRTHY